MPLKKNNYDVTVAGGSLVKNGVDFVVATFIDVQYAQQKIAIFLHVEETVTGPGFAKPRIKGKSLQQC